MVLQLCALPYTNNTKASMTVTERGSLLEVVHACRGLLNVAEHLDRLLLYYGDAGCQVSLLCICCCQILPHGPQPLGCIQP